MSLCATLFVIACFCVGAYIIYQALGDDEEEKRTMRRNRKKKKERK